MYGRGDLAQLLFKDKGGTGGLLGKCQVFNFVPSETQFHSSLHFSMYFSLLSLGMGMGQTYDDLTIGPWATDCLLKSVASSMIYYLTSKANLSHSKTIFFFLANWIWSFSMKCFKYYITETPIKCINELKIIHSTQNKYRYLLILHLWQQFDINFSGFLICIYTQIHCLIHLSCFKTLKYNIFQYPLFCYFFPQSDPPASASSVTRIRGLSHDIWHHVYI